MDQQSVLAAVRRAAGSDLSLLQLARLLADSEEMGAIRQRRRILEDEVRRSIDAERIEELTAELAGIIRRASKDCGRRFKLEVLIDEVHPRTDFRTAFWVVSEWEQDHVRATRLIEGRP